MGMQSPEGRDKNGIHLLNAHGNVGHAVSDNVIANDAAWGHVTLHHPEAELGEGRWGTAVLDVGKTGTLYVGSEHQKVAHVPSKVGGHRDVGGSALVGGDKTGQYTLGNVHAVWSNFGGIYSFGK